jgi:hypothetical protein
MSGHDWLSTAPKWHSPTVGATMSIDPTIATHFTWSPGEAETVNMTSPGFPGQVLTLVIVAGSTTSRVITLGTYFANASVFSTGSVAGARSALTFVSNGVDWTLLSAEQSSGVGGIGSGVVQSRTVAYVENATNTLHTGTVPIPAGAWVHDILITNQALWTATGAVTMKVGDTADDDGYFTGVDMKATDLAVGEVLSMKQGSIDTDGMWGGKQGAYLVAATGRRGPVATNFGMYYAAGSNITGIITVGTPATAVGRTFMNVTYSVGNLIAPVLTTP